MSNKSLQLTAIIERDDDWFVATCPEVDVVSQGKTIEDARSNLLEAVEGFFEVASASEIRRRLKKETYIMPLMPVVPKLKMKSHVRRKMPKLRVLSGREDCKILSEYGFEKVRQKGSHIIMQKRVGNSTITIPVPEHDELRIGTLSGIIKQSGLSRALFETK